MGKDKPAKAVPTPLASAAAPAASQALNSPPNESNAPAPDSPEQGKEEQSSGEPSPTSDGASIRRRPSLSQHPLFAAKARGLRTKIMRFTPSWFSVTMVSSVAFQMSEEASQGDGMSRGDGGGRHLDSGRSVQCGNERAGEHAEV